jgi:hypothetical protein
MMTEEKRQKEEEINVKPFSRQKMRGDKKKCFNFTAAALISF